MDFDSVWTLFVFIIGIGGWILDRMKKMKEENEKRQRGPAAPAGAPAAPPAAPRPAPAPVQEESADPFENLRRFLEEVEKGPQAPRPPERKPAPPPAPRPVSQAPRLAPARSADRPARRRPVEKVIRPELLRVEKPVRRLVPEQAAATVPEPAAAEGRPAGPPVSAARPSVPPVRTALHGRKNLRAALVASEILGPPAAFRSPGSRPF